MRRRCQQLSVAAVFIVVLTSCHEPLTETYIKQNDGKQTLELTVDSLTVTATVDGKSTATHRGRYALRNDQKVTTGRYIKGEDTYVLSMDGNSEGNKKWKLTIQSDSSVRDDDGDMWQLYSRSESLK